MIIHLEKKKIILKVTKVKYVKGSTKNVNKILRNNIKKIHSFFFILVNFLEFIKVSQTIKNV